MNSPFGSEIPSGDYGPAFPGGASAPLDASPEPPQTLRTSFLLWLASAALSVVGAVLTLLEIDRIVQFGVDKALEDPNTSASGVSTDQIEGFVRVSVYAGMVVSAIFVAVIVALAFLMKAGKGWARIVLTVIGVLSLLSSSWGFVSGGGAGVSTASTLVSVLGMLVLLGALVFQWLAPTNRYFAQIKAAREATVI